MKTRAAITLGLSSIVLGGAVVVLETTIASASSRNQPHAEKYAASQAAIAQNALAKGLADVAIRHAEAAVAAQPQAVPYRILLGQSYQKAGRFTSSRAAFADALSLDATSGKAALNLALMQIGTGDWAGARATLDSHATTIPVADRGLATALAGDPAAAVELLTTVARTPGADAKTRQNLALALALAGRWQDARSVVEIDVAPDEVNARIATWAVFARPVSASDQIASMLGVTPVVDAGQPSALALLGNTVPAVPGSVLEPARPALAEATADEVSTTPRGSVVAASSVAQSAVVGAAGTNPSQVIFAARHEVVQPLPVRARAPALPSTLAGKVGRVTSTEPFVSPMPRPLAKGRFYVQLGAYQNAAVARDGWNRAARRFARLASQTPQGMSVTTAVGTFYRLSIGGFARADATSMCNSYRARGGVCFVRSGAGDQVAMWAKSGRQMASR